MTTGQSTNRETVKHEFSPNEASSRNACRIPVKVFPEQLAHMLFLAEEYERIGETLKYRNEEFQRVVRETEQMSRYWTANKDEKTRTCERCPKWERRNKHQASLITRLMKLVTNLAQFIPHAHSSSEKYLKELNELETLTSRNEGKIVIVDQPKTIIVESSPKRDKVITIEPTHTAVRCDETVLDTTLKSTPPNVGPIANRTDHWDENRIAKCSERANGEISPVVERSRNNKRRLKCISTKKRSKTVNGETFVNRDSDSEFPDFEVISCSSKSRAETPDVLSVQNCAVGLVETPPTGDAGDDPSLNSIDDIIEPTQKVPNRRVGNRGRRSLVFSKPNLNDATIEQLPDAKSKAPVEKTSPLNIVITSSSNSAISGSVVKSPSKGINSKVKADEVEESVFKNPKAQGDGTEKKKPETKWNLAPSRQPTTSKLKQTLLSMSTVPKKTDITKQEKFYGGLLRPAETMKKIENETKLLKKVNDENSVPPSFDSAITSTANDVVFKTPMKSDKVDRFAKYVDNVVDNSFDVIPKTSPDYKYKRDAVRKKCERRKLPGQRCDCCTDYYEGLANDVGETQAQMMKDKFSRHRDKNPQVDTPPGLWNPVFDTNDEMLVMSRH